MSAALEVVLLRHGATAGNAAHRYVGKRTDEPLSAAGRAQCKAAGAAHDVERVFSSPMLRARQTAQICFPRARIEAVPGLEEFDFGDFEGRTADEMAGDAAYRAWVDGNCEGACPNGESRAAYLARSNAALEQVLRTAHAQGEARVVVVAHGGTIMAAMSAFATPEEQRGYFAWQVGNAQGYTARAALSGVRPVLSQCRHFTTLPLS